MNEELEAQLEREHYEGMGEDILETERKQSWQIHGWDGPFLLMSFDGWPMIGIPERDVASLGSALLAEDQLREEPDDD